jgi:hypothetical protein
MTLKEIPRTAIDSYLKVVRLPVDRAIALFDRDGEGGSGAALAVDRLDATVRDLAGRAVGDEVLR